MVIWLSCMLWANSPYRSCLAWPAREVCGLSNDSLIEKALHGGGGWARVCEARMDIGMGVGGCYELHMKSILRAGRVSRSRIAGDGVEEEVMMSASYGRLREERMFGST
jgi:hypothetical protein